MNSDPVDLLVKLIKCKSVTPNDDGALAVIENILKKNILRMKMNGSMLIIEITLCPKKIMMKKILLQL